MSKTQKYWILIVALLTVNLILFFGDELFNSGQVEAYYFDQSFGEIQSIKIEQARDTILLEKASQSWQLNKAYVADPGFVNTLLSVLERLEKGRVLKSWDREAEGSLTILWENGNSRKVAYAVNPNRTKTYFIVEGEVVQVAVPGYRDNVADIFQLHADQWRDRLVFDGSWRTIQAVSVQMLEESFEIKFQDKFFLVNGENPADSAAVIDYLNQFEQFQANEMISQGRFPSLDSLAKTSPIARITLDDIKNEEPTSFDIFPSLTRQNYHLIIDSQGNWMVVDSRRVQQLLALPR